MPRKRLTAADYADQYDRLADALIDILKRTGRPITVRDAEAIRASADTLAKRAQTLRSRTHTQGSLYATDGTTHHSHPDIGEA